ncbi:MAG: hypothetical protein IIA59_06770 [Candidatus Marinimicrobia bacterium]|nr:hypothetical protein [Candidatus Neomarinimicrobiota bacterium]
MCTATAREVDIAGSAMPLQKIETIDQPRSEAAAAGQLDAFEEKNTHQDDFREGGNHANYSDRYSYSAIMRFGKALVRAEELYEDG